MKQTHDRRGGGGRNKVGSSRLGPTERSWVRASRGRLLYTGFGSDHIITIVIIIIIFIVVIIAISIIILIVIISIMIRAIIIRSIDFTI